MNTLQKIKQINSQRGNLILKAFGNHLIPLSFNIAEEFILKSERANHKYIRKEGEKNIYKENEDKSNDESKQLDNELKKRGYILNSQYRYGKKISNEDYITGYYSKKDKKYKIGGVHKFKTLLGENSIGINFEFDNEKDFWNKLKELDK